MNKVVRIIGALVFVASLGVVLTIPLRSSDQESAGELPKRSALPTPAPSPSPSKAELAEFPRSKRFYSRFPRSCLRPAEPVSGDGLMAAASRGRVVIATPSGAEVASFRSSPPVAWSPSGSFVAAGPAGALWHRDGKRVERHERYQQAIGKGAWGWSPTSDCALRVDARGLLSYTAVDPSKIPPTYSAVLAEKAESFAFSPDGRKLGVLTREAGPRSQASIWIADLEQSRMEELRRFRRAPCCITLGGWSPDGQHLLYWAAPGASVSADGWPLTSVTVARTKGIWGSTLTNPTVLEECGARLVGLTGGDRFQQGNRIAVLQRGREPQGLTSRDRYHSFACSRSGALIAAIRDYRLVLFDGAGNFVRNLTTIETANGVWTELSPDWGPPGTGILFIRGVHNTRQLAFLREGAAEPNFVASVEGLVADLAFDWSATPPRGLAN